MALPASEASEWRRYGYLPIVAAIGYSTATLPTYGMGSFIDPLQREFDWNRAQVSTGLALAGLVGAAMAIPMGLLIDRWGPRRIALTGVLMMSGAFALLGTSTGSPANWVLLWCLVAIAGVFLQATVWTSAVSSRFRKARGLAFAVTLTGASISATMLPVLATGLIQQYGWRMAFAGIGGIWAAVTFPLLLAFFRGAKDPSATAQQVPVQEMALQGATPREAWREPDFFKLLAVSALFTFACLGLAVHFIPILSRLGSEPLAAAGIASLVGISSAVGRLATGALLDRFTPRLVSAGVFVLPAISCLLLLAAGTDPLVQSLAAICFGITLGAETDVIAFLTSRRFGLRHFGVIFGTMTAALALGGALGPLAAGVLFDATGSYSTYLVLTLAFAALSSLLLATLSSQSTASPY